MLENETPTSPEETPETPTPTPTAEPAGQEPAPATEAPAAPALEDTADYWKKRHAESSREAQVLLGKNKELEERTAQLTKQHTPTEQELRDAYPTWDSMLPHEQQLARENFGLKRTVSGMSSKVATIEARQAWERDLKKATKTFPALKGREDEFEEFVMKPAHRSTPIDVLAKAFLSDTAVPTPPTPAAPRPGVERGSGGPKDAPKPKKISLEDAKKLRETNFEEYRRQTALGNIDDDI